jgi:carbamoyltransferase
MINVCISGSEHDSSLCILDDEKVLLYVQEERVSRLKRDSNLPFSFLSLVKNYTKEIDNLILVNFCDYDYKSDKSYSHRICLNYLNKQGIEIKNIELDSQQHHFYHASSAFYGSGFDDAICLIIDGWGAQFPLDDGENYIQGSETSSIYYASYPSNFELLYKNLHYDPQLFSSSNFPEIPSAWDANPSLDIGVVYGTITHHLGFHREDAGKTMGLSSYGQEDAELPEFNFKKTILSDRNLFLPNRTVNEKYFPEMKVDLNDFQKRANIAYKVQKYLEEVFLYRVKQAITLKPNCNNLVLSGGCALNILGNTLIKKNFPHLNIYIDPVSNDGCQAYGAVKYFYYSNTESKTKCPLTTVYHGPKYDLNYMKKLVEFEVMKYNKTLEI